MISQPPSQMLMLEERQGNFQRAEGSRASGIKPAEGVLTPEPNMSPCLPLLCALLLLGLSADASSGGGGTTSHSYDLSGPELRRLLSSPVFQAQRLKRPLERFTSRFGPISHSGVRVTLANGSQWLVHKGGNYGISSNTVVVAARHMSSDWDVVDTADFQGLKTVSDFVAAGGTDYSLLFDNCHLASRRMMNQP
ncbi:hypothetical protein PBY51_017105 [Eleginops maclovinus]|uniref:Uncharacterized protein n=1 Tax=Eleginops maclovinus TaxID=56733 RepID=A0AAN7XC93_ELEMC|nr:hypothetical protein PBY51_017105 [Eleginops maclovinus]